jgi:DNA-binding XRE family transcriptional regulator
MWSHPYMSWSDPLEPPPDALYIEASGNPINPIRLCRKHLSATLEQFSQLTGVHLQAIHLLENGCYYPILPRVYNYIIEHNIMSSEDLLSAYSNYQFHQRGDFGRQHNFPHLSTVGDWDGDTSPFEEFRSQIVKVTRTALAKGLCVQPAALYRLANNEVKELPALIQNALQEAGLPLDLVYELNERTREYYSVR